MMVTPVAYAHFLHMISSLAEGRVCAILEVSLINHLPAFTLSEVDMSSPDTVNSEIFARILFSRIALKDIFAKVKIRD